MKKLMLGNEAVARGLYEGGCRLVSSYPGTPSTEITEFAAKYDDIYCEWAPNEKYGDPTAGEWPPEGVHVEFNFSAPDEFPEVYQGIRIKVIYEMYDNMPAMKRVRRDRNGEPK